MSHELLLAFDPGDPDMPAAEWYECVKQMTGLIRSVDRDQVVWLLRLAQICQTRYCLIEGLCQLELDRRMPKPPSAEKGGAM
jgi:hypothetical protein